LAALSPRRLFIARRFIALSRAAMPAGVVFAEKPNTSHHVH
jgi:hypothetical protein